MNARPARLRRQVGSDKGAGGLGSDRFGGDGGAFGVWSDEPPTLTMCEDPPQRNVWHQIGNDRLTATAHLDGHVTIYASDAGTVRLSSAEPQQRSLQGGRWAWRSPDGRVIAASASPARVTWGVGAATWTVQGDGWQVTRSVWAPFGTEPVLRVDVELIATDPALQAGTFVERWAFQPLPIVIGGLMAPLTRPPAGYRVGQRLGWLGAFAASQLSRSAIIAARQLLGRQLRLQVADGTDAQAGIVVLLPRRVPRRVVAGRPTPLAGIAGRVAVTALQDGSVAAVRPVPSAQTLAAPGTAVQIRTGLLPGERTTLSYAVGLMPAAIDPRGWMTRQRATAAVTSRQAWRETFRLRTGDPALNREMAWHAGMLRSAQIAEPVFGASYVSQGSAYSYVNGLQGAVRDYAFFLIPLCLVDPAGARSMLFTMLAMQHRDGSVAYAHTGAGLRTSALIHPEPTDLPLCLLWAATEYVWMTGDRAVLTEPAPWHPSERAADPPITVAQRLLLAWRHSDEVIGLGPHGLIRIGSGDWNDPLRSMAVGRRAFRRSGESVYNSAMAAYVLPRAAHLLADTDPTAARRMRHRGVQLQDALQQSWTGRWFLRGWDGRGQPLGHNRIFLDSNAWCLIAGVGSPDDRRTLVREIATRLDDPSPIGAVSLDRPIAVRGGILAPGWDTNGGVWPALNALLAWGYAIHEPDRALALLRRTTFATHARTYPQQWPGIWSGPDAFNAHHAAEPGGTYVQPATPMAEFPVMNANAHAGPLLALVKVLGLESDAAGLAVRRAGPIRTWELETALGPFAQPPER